ncbi:MAG: hypothetical protein ACLPUO_02680 [Streptosporangiaceae bacterium]
MVPEITRNVPVLSWLWIGTIAPGGIPPPHDTEVAGRVLRAGEELDGQASDVQNLIPDPAAMR